MVPLIVCSVFKSTFRFHRRPESLAPWFLGEGFSQLGLSLPTLTALVWALGSLRGGSWVVISRVISRITKVITHIRGLITPLEDL